MKRYILPSFLFLFTQQINAQNRTIDSLRHLIDKATTDTQKLNFSNELVYNLGEINIDSSIILAKENINAAKKINYKEGEADALRLLAANYLRQGDYFSAEKNLKISEAMSIGLDDSSRISKIYSQYGMIYGMQSKYDSSIYYYHKSIDIDERHNDLHLLATAYGNLAIGYQMQSDFPQALLYQLKSLKISEQQNDVNGQAYTQMNLGNTYANMGDTSRSEIALLKGITLAKSIGVTNVELYGYSNLASLHSHSKKWQSSFNYAMKAADLAKKTGDAGIEAASLSKAALAMANMQQYAKAETLNKKAMDISDSSNQPFNIFQTYSAMGGILILQKKYKEAISFFEKSIHLLSITDRYDESAGEAYAGLAICCMIKPYQILKQQQ